MRYEMGGGREMIKRANTPGNFFYMVCNQCGPEFFDHIAFLAQNNIFRSVRAESPKIACSVSKVSSAMAKYLLLKLEKNYGQPSSPLRVKD